MKCFLLLFVDRFYTIYTDYLRLLPRNSRCRIRGAVYDNLRTRDLLQIPAANSSTFGIDSITFRGSLLWNSIPDLIKRASSAAIFKSKIRNWSGEECHSNICR